MKTLANSFLRGLAFLLPIAVTVYFFVAAFRWIDGWLGFDVPGLGMLALLGIVTVTGFLVSGFLTRRLLASVERFFRGVPIARLLYAAVRDLMGAFVGETKRFTRPVLVEVLAGSDLRYFGFITRDGVEGLGRDGDVVVFFPQSYNYTGQLALVPRARIHPVVADGAEFMAFIVSGGISPFPVERGRASETHDVPESPNPSP